jgi:hypothetical protein
MSRVWPCLLLFGLGAYHGINPAMGWLFAVSLGLQNKSRRAVLTAIPPIALGHAISITLVVALLWLAQASLPLKWVRYGAAVILFAFGLSRFLRSRHPNWVGMQVGFRDLTLWSFLMASAHGAGLMLMPILLGRSEALGTEHSEHISHAGHLATQQIPSLADPWAWLVAVVVHSTGYLLVSVLIALLVYEKLGLALLRRAWFNVDLLWMIALMISGLVLLLI